MIALVWIPLGLSLLVAGFAGFHTWRRLPVSWTLLGGLALLELMVIIQLIWCAVALPGAEQVTEPVVLIAYLIAAVVVPPIATVWGLSDKTRWGTGVIVIGAVTVGVLCLRVMSLWNG